MIPKFDECDGISVQLEAIGDREVTLKVSVCKDKQPMMWWVVEHLKQGDTWDLPCLDIRVPYKLTK